MFRPYAWSLLSMVPLVATYCHAADSTENARVTISGRVVDAESRGVPGVRVRGFAYTDLTEATTGDDGSFTLRVLEQRVRQLAIVAEDERGDRLGVYRAKWDDPPTAETPMEISLAACKHLPVRAIDADGVPAAGIRVGAIIHYAPLVSAETDDKGEAVLKLPTSADVQSLYATKPGVGFDYRVVKTARDQAHLAKWFDEPPVRLQLARAQNVEIQLIDAEGEPITGTEVYLWLLNKPGEPDSFNLGYTPTEFRATTNGLGVAEFRGVPDWSVHPLIFWPITESYVRKRILFNPQEHADGRVTVRLERLTPMSGRVQFADGRPGPDVDVHVVGAGYESDGFRETTTTDREGRFDLRVAPNLLYMLVVQDEQYAAQPIDGVVVRPDEAVEGLEFELRPATRVHGRVTVGPEEKPVAGQQMSLRQQGRNLRNLEGIELPNPDQSNRSVQPSVHRWATTDEGGRYEFFVGPGTFSLSGPSQLKAETFDVNDESELVFNFAAPRPETGPFTGRVVAGDPPRPAPGAVVEGRYRAFVGRRNLRLRADDQGRFSGERSLHITVIRAMSSDGKLAGIVEIGTDQAEATISIGPLASVRARLIDSQTRNPLPETKVRWGRRIYLGNDDAPWETAWGGTVTTDSLGSFELKGLVVGQEYSLSVPRGDGSYGGLPSVTPERAETIDLGDLPLKPPYKPPTFEERVDRELASGRPPQERYDHALKEAERLRQHVLVVFVERDAPLTESWFKLRFDKPLVRAALPDYQVLQIDAESEGAAALASRLGVALKRETLPAWRFSNAMGEKQTGPIPRLTEAGGIDQAGLLELLARHAPEPLDARQLLKDALAEAAASNRRVMIQETATWCGPCHMLARYLERHRSIWEKDYIWIRIDQRWHGSDEVMDGIKEGYRGGIPWFAILDGAGKVLATSDGPDGNIGYPGEPAGIEHFLGMLRSTMQRISEHELTTLREALESR
ncbi:MAG: carboxypeptidase regulatory-like domain-containing protein [Planctomycetes bacterium]|nr:carboxypeptidase regulatory-like domain-containing protein [Planctomycetota bacterium]